MKALGRIHTRDVVYRLHSTMNSEITFYKIRSLILVASCSDITPQDICRDVIRFGGFGVHVIDNQLSSLYDMKAENNQEKSTTKIIKGIRGKKPRS